MWYFITRNETIPSDSSREGNTISCCIQTLSFDEAYIDVLYMCIDAVMYMYIYLCDWVIMHVHVHVCTYTSQEGESYIASVVITAYIFFWCKQDDETLLERWKNENFTDLLQLHNKQPSWSDGEEKYDCDMECYRDQSTCMSF